MAAWTSTPSAQHTEDASEAFAEISGGTRREIDRELLAEHLGAGLYQCALCINRLPMSAHSVAMRVLWSESNEYSGYVRLFLSALLCR